MWWLRSTNEVFPDMKGTETIAEGREKEPLAADLALITAAQKVEHYEISGYGNARALARQIGELEAATLLSHTFGEEESADYLLTAIAKPLIQRATLEDMGAEVNLETVPPKDQPSNQARRKKPSR
jgi:Mn-containing catalase